MREKKYEYGIKKKNMLLIKSVLLSNRKVMIQKDIRRKTGKMISPDMVIYMKPEFSGCWVVAGDLTGDGQYEFISARNEQQAVTAISSYSMSGELLWTWGVSNSGGVKLTYDVPLQVYDLQGNGYSDVFFSIKGYLVILDGISGKEKERYPLPDELDVADCISFADFSAKGKPQDIVIKSRYQKLWAYTQDWDLLWEWAPKNRKTCHHPSIFDWNGDGRDEILPGKTLLNHEGKKIFDISTRKTGRRGHLDAQRIVKNVPKHPQESRIIYTYCAGKLIAVINGKGKLIWRDTGHHFESIDIGLFNQNYPSPQYYVDIDHTPFGEALGFFYDRDGNKFLELTLNYGRQHRSLDWTGDGNDELVIINEQMIINGEGDVLFSLEFHDQNGIHKPPQTKKITNYHMAILDVSKKGTGDIVVYSDTAINVYLNPAKNDKNHTSIEDFNFTFY